MKRWAIVTVVLYLLLIVAITWPIVYVAFIPNTLGREGEVIGQLAHGMTEEFVDDVPFGVYFGGLVAALVLAQVLLLVVPVKVASRRPVSQRAIAWPIAGALLAWAVLIICSALAAWEFLSNTKDIGLWSYTWAFAGLGIVWLVWTFIFGFYTGRATPQTFMGRIARGLIVGSVFELLIAVPAHVCARMRDYCCAGAFTAWGLWTGIAVMLMAFGPAAFMAFVRRYQSLKPDQQGAEQTPSSSDVP